MNKKIRGLILGGVLSLFMTTGVFATGNGNDGCQLGDGFTVGTHVNSNEHKIDNVTQDDWENYVNRVNTTKSGIWIEAPNNLNGNGWHTYKVYEDKDYNHVKDNNQQIEVVHIKFINAGEKDSNPILPPPTGDTSIIPLVIGAGATLSTLIAVNTKKKNK